MNQYKKTHHAAYCIILFFFSLIRSVYNIALNKTYLIVLLTFGVASQANAATPSHCTPKERVIFSCSVGKKIVSVCASSDLSTTTGILQYRFGIVGSPELIYPSTSLASRSVVRSGMLMFSGGGAAYLRFTNGIYAYVTYTGIGKGWKKDGLAVEKNGKLLANLICKQSATSEIGPVFFEKSGISEDTSGFSIP